MTVETQKNKLTEYKTIYEGGIGEITEKKSRFIATVRPIETEEDALAFLEEMKKKYGMPDITAMHILLGQTESLPDAVTTGNRPELPDVRCWM